jgi:hypothetical protein
MSDKNLFSKIWDIHKINPHWQSVVEDEGGIFLWRCSGQDENLGKQIGHINKKLFQNVTAYGHLFKPAYSIHDACKQPDGVLIADVMVLIQHDEELGNVRSPYFIRFWYSYNDMRWHPRSMEQIGIDSRLPDPRPRLLF